MLMRIISLSLFVVTFCAKSMALAEETYGTFMLVKGDIKVTSGKGGATAAAKTGSKVYAGDTILSGADSRAKVVMSDKNVLNILPDSKMTITKYENQASSKNVELTLEYGKVRASVEQKYDGDKNRFNVKTPTAVAGVRGTDFITGFDSASQKSKIITFSGVVAVGQPGAQGQIMNPVYVRPGMETSVEPGKPAEPPRTMKSDDIKQMNTESNSETAKGPDKKGPEDKKDANNQDGKTGGDAQAGGDVKPGDIKPGGPESGTAGERGPANIDGAAPGGPVRSPSMIGADDLKPNIGAMDPGGPKQPTQVYRPPPGPPKNPTFVDGAIQQQQTKVNIIINKQ